MIGCYFYMCAGEDQYPYLDVDKLTPTHKKNLTDQLSTNNQSMWYKFGELCDDTLQALEDLQTSTERIRAFLANCGMKELAENINSEGSISNLMFEVRRQNYWNFFDYELLEKIISRFCMKELSGKLEKYISEFKIYCRCRLCEVPDKNFKSDTSGVDPKSLLVMKLPDLSMLSPLSDLKRVERRIAMQLGIEHLQLKTVEKGCIKLTLRHFLPYCEIIPIIRREEIGLAKIGIKWLRCGDYIFDLGDALSGTDKTSSPTLDLVQEGQTIEVQERSPTRETEQRKVERIESLKLNPEEKSWPDEPAAIVQETSPTDSGIFISKKVPSRTEEIPRGGGSSTTAIVQETSPANCSIPILISKKVPSRSVYTEEIPRGGGSSKSVTSFPGKSGSNSAVVHGDTEKESTTASSTDQMAESQMVIGISTSNSPTTVDVSQYREEAEAQIAGILKSDCHPPLLTLLVTNDNHAKKPKSDSDATQPPLDAEKSCTVVKTEMEKCGITVIPVINRPKEYLHAILMVLASMKLPKSCEFFWFIFTGHGSRGAFCLNGQEMLFEELIHEASKIRIKYMAFFFECCQRHSSDRIKAAQIKRQYIAVYSSPPKQVCYHYDGVGLMVTCLAQILKDGYTGSFTDLQRLLRQKMVTMMMKFVPQKSLEPFHVDVYKNTMYDDFSFHDKISAAMKPTIDVQMMPGERAALISVNNPERIIHHYSNSQFELRRNIVKLKTEDQTEIILHRSDVSFGEDILRVKVTLPPQIRLMSEMSGELMVGTEYGDGRVEYSTPYKVKLPYYAPCYLLKCGSGDPKYLKATMFGADCILTGCKGTGSAFRKEKRAGEKFQISFVDEAPGADLDNPFYIATNVNHPTGILSITVGKGESITCVMESNYIKIISPRMGYLGFDERSMSAIFVENKNEEKKGSMWLQFEWVEQLLEEASNYYRDPKLSLDLPVNPEPNIDKLKE